MDPAGFEPEGGGLGGGSGGSQFDMINHAERRGKLHPVCSQFIARANPTPASKLAFVKSDEASLLLILLLAHCRKICM